MKEQGCLVYGAGERASALVRMVQASENCAPFWASWRGASAPDGVSEVTLVEGLERYKLVFLAVPADEWEALSESLAPLVTGAHLLIHWCPTVLHAEEFLPSQLLRRYVATQRIGAIGGPLALGQLAAGVPQGAVLASPFLEVRERGSQCLVGPALRVYGSADLIGVELSSLLQTVVGLADGLVEGLGLGPSARALAATRGLAELSRLGSAAGANPATFSGLSGVGSILHAAVGDGSDASALGRFLAHAGGGGEPEPDVPVGERVMGSLQAVCHMAESLRVDVPLSQGLMALLLGQANPASLAASLMGRATKDEKD